VLALHPELAERIDRVYLMGGSTGRGNITPVAEFNARADPEAAQRVLGAPVVDVIMFGLNVTSLATLGRPGLDRMRECSDAGARLAEIVSGYRDIGTDGWRLHDVAVIASIIDPSLFEAQPAMVEVDTGAGPGRGQTVCAFTDSPALDARAEAKEPEIQVAVGFDGDRFRSLLLERLATAP